MQNTKPCVLFLSHGGGPLPLLGDASHVEMVEKLHLMAAKIPKPAAIIVISAHWEEKIPAITSGANPSLIYDYYGFPEEAYHIEYPCPGEPLLAEQVYKLLTGAGIAARQDWQRGFDHGLFIPLKIMYPKADIPCIQLSLIQGLDPGEHIKMGRALANLDYNNLLVIGSGFSFHNLPAFFAPTTSNTKTMNEAFEQWLIETCTYTQIGEDERTQRFTGWEHAPFARYCHPREEHLMPLFVCYGVAQSASSEYIELHIMNKKSSIYLW
ncbi:MAG TPA: class III extradiol ring-cleavage dioxygenase [bacterium]|nr:class III extradiol ring-cleavage dioxygenase [bacterium]HPN44798.1 class III extradiol ring-cleavage dioxygenase [bacterium]